MDFVDTTAAPLPSTGILNAFIRILGEMIDYHLLKHIGLLTVCIANVFGLSILPQLAAFIYVLTAMLGFYAPFVFITDRAIARGIEVSQAAILLSIIGVANTFGRVASGWFADKQWTSALIATNVSLLVCGTSNLLLIATSQFYLSVTYSIVFGFMIGLRYICDNVKRV